MKRVVLTEGSPCTESISSLSEELGVDKYQLQSSLYSADEYLSNRLSISRSLHIHRDYFAFSKVAGIFPVSDQLEVEVVPKFMRGDEAWRSDFLLLLARTRWGMLAERQMVSTAKSRERGINDSLAIVFLTMFDRVVHVPIRTYRRCALQQFEIEGDLDEETVLLPDKDGFVQTTTEFIRGNDYNAIIVAAAQTLSQSVSDFDLRARLMRVVHSLGPQKALPTYIPRTVPSRFENWTNLYRFSVDILDGYGIDYANQGDVMSPGFVVRTWDAWEEFIRQALVSGMKNCTVAFQEKHPFARRDRSTVKVKPDYVLRADDGRELLVDAKYKYDDAKGKSISNADIYEGWAFMEATSIYKLVLLYPYADRDMDALFEQFQTVTDDKKMIVGIRVNPEMVGFDGAMHFAKELSNCIEPMMASA